MIKYVEYDKSLSHLSKEKVLINKINVKNFLIISEL